MEIVSNPNIIHSFALHSAATCFRHVHLSGPRALNLAPCHDSWSEKTVTPYETQNPRRRACDLELGAALEAMDGFLLWMRPKEEEQSA